jgi:pyruvate dehydrogenase E2 component (dihydrolipoamide acetyltransferase)
VAVPLIMPKFEMSQSSATIVEWLKDEGDRVEAGEPVLVVETDKVTMEVESPAAGILAGIRGGPDDVVPVTEIMAYVLRPGETLPSSGTPALPAAARPATDALPLGDGQTALPAVDAGPSVPSRQDTELPHAPPYHSDGQRATPAARRIARERAIDLRLVTGSGPRGRVQAADVELHVADTDMTGTRRSAGAGAEVADVRPMPGLRRTVAQRVFASDKATARVTLVTEADATRLVDALGQLSSAVSEVWGFAPDQDDLLAFIAARALREHPYMNARLTADGKSIDLLPKVNLGITVDTEQGLLVPVVRHACKKDLRAIATESRALAERARGGDSLPDDLRGGTFTLINLGMHDIDEFTAIINPPEAAILGVGRIQAQPVAASPGQGHDCEGEIVIRLKWTLSLTFDHRLVDGAPASRFLRRIKQLVEEPLLLLG